MNPVLSWRQAGYSFKYGNKIIVIGKAACGGYLVNLHVRMFSEAGLRFFYTQVPDVFGYAAAVVLSGKLVQMCPAYLKAAAKCAGVDILRVMCADVFINLRRKLLALQYGHALQTKMGGNRLQDVGGGGDIVFRYDWTLHACGFQQVFIDMIAGAFFPDAFPPGFM